MWAVAAGDEDGSALPASDFEGVAMYEARAGKRAGDMVDILRVSMLNASGVLGSTIAPTGVRPAAAAPGGRRAVKLTLLLWLLVMAMEISGAIIE